MKEEGFGVGTRSSHFWPDAKVKYLTLAYSRPGKYQSQAKISLCPHPSSKTGGNARIHASLYPDDKFLVTTVKLEHNHSLSSGKARYYTSNKKVDPRVNRRLEINDEAGIKLTKKFIV